jgi:uncharacterized membrane protein
MLESNLSRVQWAFRFLLTAMLATWLLSNKVWMTDRNFPMVPVFDFIPPLPSPVDYIFYCVLIILTIYQILYIENKNTKIALIALFAFLMLGDQMRWQPYNVQFFLMVNALFFFPKFTDGILNTFRALLIVFFIMTGIQEFNAVFQQSVFPWLISPIATLLPMKMEAGVLEGGYVFALLNLLTGIGLLFPKTRNIAVIAAIVISLFLFYSLSPMANDWNHASLPYNIVTAAFTYVLFYKSEFDLKLVFWNPKFYYQSAVIAVFAIIPLLSFAGLYDRMQCFNAYSGKSLYAKIYVTEDLVDLLPDGVKRYVYRPPMGEPYLETTYWSFNALKVSPYSEKRVYEKLQEYVCSFSEGECSARLEIYTYNGR